MTDSPPPQGPQIDPDAAIALVWSRFPDLPLESATEALSLSNGDADAAIRLLQDQFPTPPGPSFGDDPLLFPDVPYERLHDFQDGLAEDRRLAHGADVSIVDSFGRDRSDSFPFDFDPDVDDGGYDTPSTQDPELMAMFDSIEDPPEPPAHDDDEDDYLRMQRGHFGGGESDHVGVEGEGGMPPVVVTLDDVLCLLEEARGPLDRDSENLLGGEDVRVCLSRAEEALGILSDPILGLKLKRMSGVTEEKESWIRVLCLHTICRCVERLSLNSDAETKDEEEEGEGECEKKSASPTAALMWKMAESATEALKELRSAEDYVNDKRSRIEISQRRIVKVARSGPKNPDPDAEEEEGENVFESTETPPPVDDEELNPLLGGDHKDEMRRRRAEKRETFVVRDDDEEKLGLNTMSEENWFNGMEYLRLDLHRYAAQGALRSGVSDVCETHAISCLDFAEFLMEHVTKKNASFQMLSVHRIYYYAASSHLLLATNAMIAGQVSRCLSHVESGLKTCTLLDQDSPQTSGLRASFLETKGSVAESVGLPADDIQSLEGAAASLLSEMQSVVAEAQKNVPIPSSPDVGEEGGEEAPDSDSSGEKEGEGEG